MEMNYYMVQQGSDGVLFSKIKNSARFPSRSERSSHFKPSVVLLFSVRFITEKGSGYAA